MSQQCRLLLFRAPYAGESEPLESPSTCTHILSLLNCGGQISVSKKNIAGRHRPHAPRATFDTSAAGGQGGAAAAATRVDIGVPSRPRARPLHSAFTLLQVWPPPSPSLCIAVECGVPPRWAPSPPCVLFAIGLHFSVAFPRR